MGWYQSQIPPKQKILSQGVDITHFTNKPRLAHPSRGFPSLITVARLDEQKNIESVIEAVSILKVKYPSISYDVVGSGPYQKTLKDKAIQFGVEKIVHFQGYANPERIPQLLNDVDFFVLPSSSRRFTFGCFGSNVMWITNHNC